MIPEGVALKEAELLEELADQNKRLIYVLSQYTSISNEEKKLKDITDRIRRLEYN